MTSLKKRQPQTTDWKFKWKPSMKSHVNIFQTQGHSCENCKRKKEHLWRSEYLSVIATQRERTQLFLHYHYTNLWTSGESFENHKKRLHFSELTMNAICVDEKFFKSNYGSDSGRAADITRPDVSNSERQRSRRLKLKWTSVDFHLLLSLISLCGRSISCHQTKTRFVWNITISDLKLYISFIKRDFSE